MPARRRELAFTYVNDELKDRVVKIAAEFGAVPVLPCDVAKDDDIDALFASAASGVGRPRRAAAFDRVRSARSAGRRLPRRLSRNAFAVAQDISSYSFAALAKGARPLMRGRPGSILTLTYLGAVRSVPNYNVMGLAKASLEANVRYLAACLGPEGIRVNGISAGPIKTLAAAGHRRLLEAPDPRREDGAAATQRHDRRGRQRRRVLFLGPRERDHRRDHLRRLRLFDGRDSVDEIDGASCRGRVVKRLPDLHGFRIDRVPPAAASTPSSSAAATTASSAPRISRRAGQDVCVLERRGVLGGAAVTEEFHPGFRNSTASYTVSLLDPQVIRDLKLAEHGLRVVERPIANFLPLPDGQHLKVGGGLAATQAEVAKFSRRDADALAGVLRDARPRRRRAARPAARHAAQRRRRHACAARSRGRWRSAFARSISPAGATCSIFSPRAPATCSTAGSSRDPIKAAFGFDAVVGNFASPYTPGSAYVLLHHVFGEVNGKRGQWGHASGGMGAITQAMADECAARGVALRTNAPVARVIVKAGRAAGVELADGEVVEARRVVANVESEAAVRAGWSTPRICPRISARASPRYRCGSGTFRMNVALSELPDFTCAARKRSRSRTTRAASSLRRRSRTWSARISTPRTHGWSRAPIVEVLIPSVVDDIAGAARACTSRAFSASTSTPICRR